MKNLITENNERPEIRELVLSKGLSFPSDTELLMLILGRGTRNNHVEEMATQVLKVIDVSTENNLIQNLVKIEGIGVTKALSIAACMEFGKRRNLYRKAQVNRASDILPFVKHFSLKKTEHFIVITVNGSREIINIRTVCVGSANRAIFYIRDIFTNAVQENASAIICCHNHPCDNCTPSEADIECTKKIREAANILGISFLDHLIITKDNYFSFLESGLLEADECKSPAPDKLIQL